MLTILLEHIDHSDILLIFTKYLILDFNHIMGKVKIQFEYVDGNYTVY